MDWQEGVCDNNDGGSSVCDLSLEPIRRAAQQATRVPQATASLNAQSLGVHILMPEDGSHSLPVTHQIDYPMREERYVAHDHEVWLLLADLFKEASCIHELLLE